MGTNPAWHGSKYTNNFACYKYVVKVAEKVYDRGDNATETEVKNAIKSVGMVTGMNSHHLKDCVTEQEKEGGRRLSLGYDITKANTVYTKMKNDLCSSAVMNEIMSYQTASSRRGFLLGMASHIATDYFAHATRFHNKYRSLNVPYYNQYNEKVLHAGAWYDNTHDFYANSVYHSDRALDNQYRFGLAKCVLANVARRYRKESTSTEIYYDFFDNNASFYYDNERRDPLYDTNATFRLYYAYENALSANMPQTIINSCYQVDYEPGVHFK